MTAIHPSLICPEEFELTELAMMFEAATNDVGELETDLLDKMVELLKADPTDKTFEFLCKCNQKVPCKRTFKASFKKETHDKRTEALFSKVIGKEKKRVQQEQTHKPAPEVKVVTPPAQGEALPNLGAPATKVRQSIRPPQAARKISVRILTAPSKAAAKAPITLDTRPETEALFRQGLHQVAYASEVETEQDQEQERELHEAIFDADSEDEQEGHDQDESDYKAEKIESRSDLVSCSRKLAQVARPLVTRGKPLALTSLSQHKIVVEQDKSRFGFPTIDDGIKPQIGFPKIALFCVYYILTKLGFFAAAANHHVNQQNIKALDQESTKIRTERIEELRELHAKAKITNRWGLLTKVITWFTSITTILTGVTLCLTGAGAFAGGMLVLAGLISLTNQLLEITGGWQKIAEEIGGDDPEKTRAMIMWMQIGITVLCMVLAGGSAVFAGFDVLKGAMGTIASSFNIAATIGIGTVIICKGMTEKEYWDRMAYVKKHDRQLREIKHRREDLMEISQTAFENTTELMESFHRILEIRTSTTKMIHSINKR